MPNIERGGIGVSVDSGLALVDRLSLGGVVLPGSVGYDVYPQAAAPVNVTTSASADTLGSDATVISGSTITVPFYLLGLVCLFGDTGGLGRYRYATKVATVLVRSGLYDPFQDSGSTQKADQHYEPWSPYPCPANAAVTVATAGSQASAEITSVYAHVLSKPPVSLSLNLLGVPRLAVQTLLPNSTTGTALTSSTAWAYGSYVQITAGIATPILITRIVHESVTVNRAYQLALATGAAASEVDFAVVGGALGVFGGAVGTMNTPLIFPVLINANTRIAARVRDSGGSSAGYAVWIEYYPLPAL